MTNPSPPAARWRWLPVTAACAAWLGYVLSLELRNPRLIASWHGLVHVAIVSRFPSPTLVPENPFSAGDPLPYYWFYHWLGSMFARTTGLDPLTALQVIALLSLTLLVVAGMRAGARLAPSAWAGVLVASLALAGANPLGPALAAVRAVVRHQPLLTAPGSAAPIEQVFATDSLADGYMSRPLLPSLYLSTDWRNGPNIHWFFDISSRGPSLALLLVVLALLLGNSRPLFRSTAIGLSIALVTALNPIVGLAAGGLLGAALLILALLERREIRTYLAIGIGMAAGVVLAFPTFRHLLGQGGTAGFSEPGILALKIASTSAALILLAPLAIWGAWSAEGPTRVPIRAMALTGLGLGLMVVAVHLEEGNEHNLLNAAQVVLAVPAVAGVFSVRRPQALALATLLALLPMTAATWVAFEGRPPLPLVATGGRLVRVPATHPVARLEAWLRDSTPSNAVLVTDPDTTMKMSGNMAELPALTSRALLTDQPSYLTRPSPEATLRRDTARRAVHGVALEEAQGNLLGRLGRPLYVISWHAERDGSLLTGRWGPPVFHDGEVGAWALPASPVRRGGT
jgi:hypothetical protein